MNRRLKLFLLAQRASTGSVRSAGMSSTPARRTSGTPVRTLGGRLQTGLPAS